MRSTTGLLRGAGRLFALALLAAVLATPSRALAEQASNSAEQASNSAEQASNSAQPPAEPAGVGAGQAETAPSGEASLVLPDLNQTDVGGYNGRTLLLGGMVVAALGIAFGLVILTQLKNLPVHRSMREVSELIYETCKTYLLTQGKFLALLEIFIAVIIVL